MTLRRLFTGFLFVSALSAVPGAVAVVIAAYLRPTLPWARLLRHSFGQPWGLVLLALVPGVLALLLWNAERRRRALARLGSSLAIESLLAVRRGLGVFREAALLLALALLAVGTAAPKWGDDDQPIAPGRDLVVVLDCSRSMSAETPSRFEIAREALLNLCAELQKRGGHRIGLVVFAGRAELACPLTHDYDHFRETLMDLDPKDSAGELGPGEQGESGTRIGEGLAVAVQAHDELYPETADILLLSDGDDPMDIPANNPNGKPENEWRLGIAAAKARIIPVYVVGVGDAKTAYTIPDGENKVFQYKEENVLTRLHEEPLKEIAGETGGFYKPAPTRGLPLGKIYMETIATKPVREASDDKVQLRREHYFWFLLPAFALVAVAVALPDRLPQGPHRRKRKRPVLLETSTP